MFLDPGTEPLDTGRMGRKDRRFAQDRWFDEGAAALRRALAAMSMQDALPSLGQFYACPLCLTAHGREALDGPHPSLTDEHVPPRAAGGSVLVLACAKCNNTAGTALDAHASRREEMHDLLAGRDPGRDLRAEFAVDDIVMRVRVNGAADALRLTVVDRANNPKDVAAATNALEAWAASGERPGGRIWFRLTEKTLLTRAQLSYLRAAYLAAFAALGWRYVLGLPCLSLLRAQLADADAAILPPLALLDLRAPASRRQLFIVREPTELRSLAVVLGRYTVFLPWMEDLSGGVMILKFGSSQVNRYKCRLRHVRQVSRTGGAGR
jgi:hypothetical protein